MNNNEEDIPILKRNQSEVGVELGINKTEQLWINKKGLIINIYINGIYEGIIIEKMVIKKS